MKLDIYRIDFYYFLFIIFIKIAIFIFKIIIYQNMAMVVKDNNSKRRCYDMRLYLVEWVVLNPEAGREMKYIYNMSEVKMLKNQVFVLSCRMNDVEVEVKERWFKRRFEEVVN